MLHSLLGALAFLLLFGLLPDSAVADGRSDEALFAAAIEGDAGGIDAALRGGATVNSADKDGWTALMFAAGRRRESLVGQLLGAGADPNLKNAEGNTPMIVLAVFYNKAVEGNTPEQLEAFRRTAQQLLSAGANASHVNNAGKTALTLMMAGRVEGSDDRIAELLRKHGALNARQISDLQIDLVRLGYATKDMLTETDAIGPMTQAAIADMEKATGAQPLGLPSATAAARLTAREKELRDDLLQRVRLGHGVLDGAHGVYNGAYCEAAQDNESSIDRVVRIGSEVIAWSDDSTVFASFFRGYKVLHTKIIEEVPGDWTFNYTRSKTDWKSWQRDIRAYTARENARTECDFSGASKGQEWRESCVREVNIRFPSPEGQSEPMPNPARYQSKTEHSVLVRKLRALEKSQDGTFDEYDFIVGPDFIKIGKGILNFRCELK